MNTQPQLENRYTRMTIAPGLIAWIYEYRNPQPIRKLAAMATGLELGVQLAGQWWQRGSYFGERLYGPGEIHALSPAETYELAYQASERPGLQVGFILYPDEINAYSSLSGMLRFAGGGLQDRAFTSFCRDFCREVDRAHAPLVDGHAPAVIAEVRGFIERSCELVAADPIVVAKQAIDRNFAHPLYVQQIAEIAGLHPITLARQFAKRFGLTPIRYRLLLRLNEAARLTWAWPELSIPQIGHRVGFDDPVYFYRAFKSQFGMTPALYGRRMV